MRIAAPAKVNLVLDVLGRRADGYHDIHSVMQSIDLHDDVDVELTDRSGAVALTVSCEASACGIPDGDRNIAHRAAAAMLAEAGTRAGARITLTKRVPVQAGLGGGSSDAAAVLVALGRLLGDPVSPDRMVEIAAILGADVPFFLTGGRCLVEGIGERVTPLPDLPARPLIIVKPEAGISTAEAYAQIDRARGERIAPTPQAWDERTLRNDFHEIVMLSSPAVRAAHDALIRAGCEQALLCGSGSAVFGTLDASLGAAEARALAQLIALEMAREGAFRVWTASTIRRGEIGRS